MASQRASALYTQESQFEQAFATAIPTWWQSRQEGQLRTADKRRLYWCQFTHPEHKKAILLVNGRIECTWKYQELMYDLFQQGFDVFSFDHRGQGWSERLMANSDMGHVERFEDYVDDLECVVAHFDWSGYQQRLLLAHSMGGAIATRYLQRQATQANQVRTHFDGLILSAPMFGVNLPWYLKPIATPMTAVMSLLSPTPSYAPGHGAYYAKPFDDNPLTHSEIRYRWFRALYDAHPQIQVGGPSTHWVWQGLLASKQCVQLARHLTLPVLLLQASGDTIVSNKAQQRFIQKLARSNPNAQLVSIEGARHEIFFEQDCYRNAALNALSQFSAQLACPADNPITS